MSNTPRSRASELAEAIGDVCIQWAAIEDVVSGLVLHTWAYLEHAFETSASWDLLALVLDTADIRQKVSITKLLAHHVKNPNSPDFFERVEKIMNYLDNEVRPERNRYIHDTWYLSAGTVIRRDNSPKIQRVQSRQTVLNKWTDRVYADIGQIREFMKNLEFLYDDLALLEGHLAWLSVVRERPPEFPQPLPQVWQSLVHRDWREPSKQ